MNCEQIKYQLIDYIDGNLEPTQKTAIEKHLKNCTACEAHLIQTGQLLTEISKTVFTEPSTRLKTQFYKMLEAEKSSLHVTPLKPATKIRSFKHLHFSLKIASLLIVFLALGVLLGRQWGTHQQQTQELSALRLEVSELKQNMSLVSLNQPSASKRIQAIHTVNNTSAISDEMLDALIHTMNTDGNVNVRMAAMYALSKYSQEESVKVALIASLNKQSDALLQITLINILVGMQDARAKEPIERIMHQEDTPDIVKKQAETGLSTFL